MSPHRERAYWNPQRKAWFYCESYSRSGQLFCLLTFRLLKEFFITFSIFNVPDNFQAYRIEDWEGIWRLFILQPFIVFHQLNSYQYYIKEKKPINEHWLPTTVPKLPMMTIIFQVYDLLGKAKETDTILRCAVRDKVDKILEVKEGKWIFMICLPYYCALSVSRGYFS